MSGDDKIDLEYLQDNPVSLSECIVDLVMNAVVRKKHTLKLQNYAKELLVRIKELDGANTVIHNRWREANELLKEAMLENKELKIKNDELKEKTELSYSKMHSFMIAFNDVFAVGVGNRLIKFIRALIVEDPDNEHSKLVNIAVELDDETEKDADFDSHMKIVGRDRNFKRLDSIARQEPLKTTGEENGDQNEDND